MFAAGGSVVEPTEWTAESAGLTEARGQRNAGSDRVGRPHQPAFELVRRDEKERQSADPTATYREAVRSSVSADVVGLVVRTLPAP